MNFKKPSGLSPHFLLSPKQRKFHQTPPRQQTKTESSSEDRDSEPPKARVLRDVERSDRSWGLMKLTAVKAATTKSRSTIYAEVAAGRFPAPIKIGPRAIAWREEAVRAHLDALERGETPIYPVAE